MKNNSSSEFILDFFGLPGSGKTTIAHMIACQLKENGYKTQENIYHINNEYSLVRRILVKVFYTITFTLKNFIYMIQLFLMLEKKSAFINWKGLIKQWVNVCFVLTAINKKNNSHFIIADQGIVQAAISLAMYSGKTSVIDIYMKLCEQVVIPIKYVYVEIDVSTDMERLKFRENRNSKPGEEKDIDYTLIQLQGIMTKCEEIADIIECITIENNNSVKLKQNKNGFPINLQNIINSLGVPVKAIN